MRQRKVYLIGAGPGDLDLLTIKAVNALKKASVWLIDDLVNPEIRQFASSNTRIISVGKRGGCRSTPQVFIQRQMIQLAHEGYIVARVKGGDPFLFGRGGEEMLALQSTGINVEIISGITAGIAVPATVGIPVTHRGICQGVTFVTGHSYNDTSPNWQALAQSGTTLVIYMGMINLSQIADALIEAGMDANTLAAAIQNGTLPNQKQVISTLSQISQAAIDSYLGSPAVVVIGEVVNLAMILPINIDQTAVA